MFLNNFTPTEKEKILKVVFNQQESIYNFSFERGNDSFKTLNKREIQEILMILKGSRSLKYGLSGNKEVLVELLTSVGFGAKSREIGSNSSPLESLLEIQPYSFLALDFGIKVELLNFNEEN
ncbi:hypothetical protein ACTFIV_007202 [Dictyostelium citrinum]